MTGLGVSRAHEQEEEECDMNKYYVKGCKRHGPDSYTDHDKKVIKLKKSRRKTKKASQRKNRKK